MKYLKLFPCMLIFLLILVACESDLIKTNMSEDIENFNFINQDNESFGLENLKGEWWLAYFMYTECTKVCPITTPNMLKVKSALKEDDLDIQVVSFSVDPEYDTPKVLNEYANENEIKLDGWTLLTGYEFETIKKFAAQSFNAYVDQGSPGEVEFAHSTNFFLINPDGEVIKKYNGMGTEDLDVILKDLNEVL